MAKEKPVRVPRRYESCPDSVTDLVRRVRRERFPSLDGVTITCDFSFAPTKDGIPTSDDLKHHGWPCAAIIKIVSLKDRVSGLSDAILRISGNWWIDHPDEYERISLITHELTHIILTDKEDSFGRPVLKMRPHDYEATGFYDCIEQDQEHSIDLQQIAAVNKQLRDRNLLQKEFWG